MSRTDRTDKKRQKFLDALAETASVVSACDISNVPRRTAYDWRKADASFAEAWDSALDVGTDALEDEAVRRAYSGWNEPVHYQGVQTSTIRKYSDTLLIFLLKGRRPEKYKERQEVTGANGKPLIPVVNIVRDSSSTD